MTTSVLNNSNSSNNKSNNSSSNNKSNTNSTNSVNNNKNTTSTTTSNNNISHSSDIAASATTPTASTPATATATATAAASAAAAAASRSMQSDEDFNIRFVNLVRAHKCLYDKKVPEYRNRDNQEKAWMLISQETCESVIHCKERWRNLRACLSRYIKQQSGADPQHKPYYLTEHMSFLLPFLKSTRNSLEAAAAAVSATTNKSGLAVLLHLSQQQHQQLLQHEQQPTSSSSLNALPLTVHMQSPHDELHDMKQSLSENEETIDAFDPAVITAAALQQLQQHHVQPPCSPPLSDTASANSIQNFIPDVQLAELRTPEPPNMATDLFVVGTPQQPQQHALPSTRHPLLLGVNGEAHHEYNNVNGSIASSSSAAKRIKTECNTNEAATAAMQHCYGGGSNVGAENVADMDFFRSIMPDIAALTPQQKRKLKIGILELIDDVVERFPPSVMPERSNSRGGGNVTLNGTTFMGNSGNITGVPGVGGSTTTNCRAQQQQQQTQRRSSGRDWRK